MHREEINKSLLCSKGVNYYTTELGQLQWRSHEIAVARAQHGHTMFVQTSARSAEAYTGVWGHPPPESLGISQPPRPVLRPYAVAKCKSLTANSRMMSV